MRGEGGRWEHLGLAAVADGPIDLRRPGRRAR